MLTSPTCNVDGTGMRLPILARQTISFFGVWFFCAMLIPPSVIAGEDQDLNWRPWDEWDRVTKSYAPIDSTIESRKDVMIAKARLSPGLPPFLFIHRLASGWCGSGGCSLEVLKEERGSYELFQQWMVDEIRIRTDTVVSGWYPLVLEGNVWVYDGSQYMIR